MSLKLIDQLLVISMALFFVIGLCVDYINAFAPIGGVTVESSLTWKWPPSSVWSCYWWWVRECDPLLLKNPAWCWFVSMFSPVFYCPFYLWSIHGITNRRDNVRMPMVIYGTLLFLTLSIYFIEALWGDLPSPNMLLFTAGYGYYLIFGPIVIYRFWNDNPFKIYK